MQHGGHAPPPLSMWPCVWVWACVVCLLRASRERGAVCEISVRWPPLVTGDVEPRFAESVHCGACVCVVCAPIVIGISLS